jgi:hypothetical protein
VNRNEYKIGKVRQIRKEREREKKENSRKET